MRTLFKILALNVSGLKSLPKRRHIAKFLMKERVTWFVNLSTWIMGSQVAYFMHLPLADPVG